MTNEERLNLFNNLIGLLGRVGYSDYAATKLKEFSAELAGALIKISRDDTVWPEVDWEAVVADLRARNPNDPSIPLPKNIDDHEGQ